MECKGRVFQQPTMLPKLSHQRLLRLVQILVAESKGPAAASLAEC